MLTWREERDLKIALLQIRKLQPHFICSINGDFAQKRKLRAQETAEVIRQQLQAAANRLRWRFAPRARIAVTMTFFSGENRTSPAVHNLVKYYMDEMRSILFKDDRQVSYLTAQSFRAAARERASVKKGTSTVYLQVQRFSDYKKKFDLYFTLMEYDRFKGYLESREIGFDDDYAPDLDSLRPLDVSIFPPEARAFVQRMYLKEKQRFLLRLNNLNANDGPGHPPWAKYFPEDFMKIRELKPYLIDLGSLPTRDQTAEYKRRIREGLQKLRAKHPVFNPIVIPIELDVQVSSHAFKVGKDLDNIMRDIIPIFTEEFLAEDTYIHGYRIYNSEDLTQGSAPNSLRLKILPMGAIAQLDRVIDKSLDFARDWISREIYL